MRFSKWLVAAAAGLATFAATAQDRPAPAGEPPAKAAPEPGLSDLRETVDQLLREENSPATQTQPPQTSEPAPAETAPTEATPAEAAPAEAAPAEAQAPPSPEPEAAPAPPRPRPRAAESEGPAPPLTREQTAALDRTMARGQLLVGLARGGLVATQDMLTRLSDPSGAGISGWIAEPAGNSTIVTFYAAGADGAAPKAVYRATVLGGRVTSREIFLGADRPALTPIQARMAAARSASENDEMHACGSQPFNVLVVPPATARASVDVYRISAPSQRGHFPLGGHYRSTVAADGTVETHAFTEGCVDVSPPAVAAGAEPAPIAVTDLLDPMPTEVNMLLAQQVGRPLRVTAGDPHRIWMVTGDRIAEVRN